MFRFEIDEGTKNKKIIESESVTDVKNYKPSIDSIRAMVKGKDIQDNGVYDFENGETDGEINRRSKLFYSDITEIDAEIKEEEEKVKAKAKKAKNKKDNEALAKAIEEENTKKVDALLDKVDERLKKAKTN